MNSVAQDNDRRPAQSRHQHPYRWKNNTSRAKKHRRKKGVPFSLLIPRRLSPTDALASANSAFGWIVGHSERAPTRGIRDSKSAS
jgi:hypothetical protein